MQLSREVRRYELLLMCVGSLDVEFRARRAARRRGARGANIFFLIIRIDRHFLNSWNSNTYSQSADNQLQLIISDIFVICSLLF